MRRFARHIGKSAAELTLPIAEGISGFHTARGDYLRNRIRMLFNRYEATECTLMRQYLRPGQTILDVGANVGYLTRFFARAAGETGRVVAFEPNPVIFPLLQRNVRKFPAVSSYNVGFSSSSGDAELFLAGTDHSVASLAREYPATHVFYQESGKLASTAVKLAVGDEFLRRIGVGNIDVLKLDVEGWELDVLAGLERTIAASPQVTIFCEFNPAAQKCAGRSPTDLPEWFLARNFSLAYADQIHLLPISDSTINDFSNQIKPGGFVTLFATRG